jgi:hypothetical protein
MMPISSSSDNGLCDDGVEPDDSVERTFPWVVEDTVVVLVTNVDDAALEGMVVLELELESNTGSSSMPITPAACASDA